jgi:hypothetical protein
MVILWFFQSFLNFSKTLRFQLNEFENVQKAIDIAMYLLSFDDLHATNYDAISKVIQSNYNFALFNYKEKPFVIFLKPYSKPSCSDCVYFFYNTSNSCYEFYESASLNYTTNIEVIIFSKKYPSIAKIGNPNIVCYDFLNVSIAKLGSVRTFKYCEINLYKNTGVLLCDIEDIIIVDKYRSLLNLLLGNSYTFSEKGANFTSPTETLTFFKLGNNSINFITLNVK